MAAYSKEDQEQARLGTLPLGNTDLEVIIYRINEHDACLLVNKER